MFKNIKKALVLAPHTDDGEFGCGGTISKLIDQGLEVHYVAFSACEQSVLPQFPKNILITEVKAATLELGIHPDNLHLLKFEVRTFNFHRQEILDYMISFRNKYNPDLILIPSIADVHQDHFTIANEAIRAFKFKNILSYEMPWNNFNFNTCYFTILNKDHLNKKVDALKHYKSQMHRPYATEEFIRALAKVRGVQVGQEYGEVFEVIRLIG